MTSRPQLGTPAETAVTLDARLAEALDDVAGIARAPGETPLPAAPRSG